MSARRPPAQNFMQIRPWGILGKWVKYTPKIFIYIYSLKDFGLTALNFSDVIGHVTIKLRMCGFLLVVHCNHASILHRYGDMEPQRCGHDLDLSGSRDVIGHVTVGLGTAYGA